MKLAVFAAVLVVSTPLAQAGQTRRPAAPPAPARQAPDRIAEAYEQFLQGHLLEDEDAEAAIAAYRRAMVLDPSAADIPADLAELYMRENKPQEAIQAAEAALRAAPQNRDAHRVLGTVYASMAGRPGRGGRDGQQQNVTNAIRHLEQAFDPPMAAADANLRAMLARLYIASDQYEKAIPVLADLVKQEPGWSDGPTLLIEAYSAAGRTTDAIAWLEESAPENPRLYASLGEFYARGRRWNDSAAAYEKALEASPGSFDWRLGMAESLLNAGNRADVIRSRDVLREAVAMKSTDERALYLLSEAERASGDSVAAETAARKLIAQNPRNQRGFMVLAQALEDQRRFEPIVDALVPALQTFRAMNNGAMALRTLLPHLGFAYQELGQYDKAIAAFEEARRVSPNDASITGYLIQAQLAAKNYGAAAEIARAARAVRPDDIRLARLEAVALRRAGKGDQSIALLEDLLQKQGDNPEVHVALAQGYVEANRGAQAIKVLRDAQVRFPGETSLAFELGAVLDRQKRHAESEAVFRELIAKEPENAQALNYLGYMLAERGERLTESVDYLKRALAIEPENGSYLDSIGWAYFKDGKLDLAFENMKRAADQLLTNSVVQDHYGEVLFKLGRYDDAIGAWQRALKGDGDSIDRGDIDKKIRSARQKLPRR